MSFNYLGGPLIHENGHVYVEDRMRAEEYYAQ